MSRSIASTGPSVSARAIQETTAAFDAHAAHYDAIVEPNLLLKTMRAALWTEVERRVPPPARLLDLGCGTGLDAVHLAGRGYQVTAIDASREMVAQTRACITAAHRQDHVRAEELGVHELARMDVSPFDAIYSDLGPLNCVQDLSAVARECARLLKPGGLMVLSVMARLCPWEMLYFGMRGDFQQARRRWSRAMVPVNLEKGVVWTRYYAPREFLESFADEFQLAGYRALNLFLPPPYLLRWYQRAGILMKPLGWLDAHCSALPLLRDAGDHFLMTLQKRS